MQYRFNRKLNTPFWNECRSSVDLAGAEERAHLFTERAPLSCGQVRSKGRIDNLLLAQYGGDYFAQDYVYDILLAGQQVPARYVEPIESKSQWTRRTKMLRETVNWALPQRDALMLVRERRPEMLRDLLEMPDSWLLENAY